MDEWEVGKDEQKKGMDRWMNGRTSEENRKKTVSQQSPTTSNSLTFINFKRKSNMYNLPL